jgi:2-polyprenyl-3-methyl-5-hydroxy-6-metoxy-1,4-benzoquinol methylase
MTLPPLSQRVLLPELMDQAGLDVYEHSRALAGLRRLNLASGVARRLWQEIAAQSSMQPGGRLRVLDIASGGGDVALGLWMRARRRNIALEILGLDASHTACRTAAARCAPAKGEITFQCRDVLATALPTGFDVIVCTLFLHHLAVAEAQTLLANMRAAGPLMVLSDLRRCSVGYAIAHAACRMLTRSPIVHYDGPQSVASAFSLAEMRSLCQAAGLANAIVRPVWPWRILVVHRHCEHSVGDGA